VDGGPYLCAEFEGEGASTGATKKVSGMSGRIVPKESKMKPSFP
jgi:hypothetical protein